MSKPDEAYRLAAKGLLGRMSKASFKRLAKYVGEAFDLHAAAGDAEEPYWRWWNTEIQREAGLRLRGGVSGRLWPYLVLVEWTDAGVAAGLQAAVKSLKDFEPEARPLLEAVLEVIAREVAKRLTLQS